MKTQILKDFARLINECAINHYGAAGTYGNVIRLKIDKNRNANGQRMEVLIEGYSINMQDNCLCVDLFFSHDKSDEVETISLPIKDFQQWCVWNGNVIWYQQTKGLLAWGQTVQEEVNGGVVLNYLQDICMGLIAYKQADFSVQDYEDGELYVGSVGGNDLSKEIE